MPTALVMDVAMALLRSRFMVGVVVITRLPIEVIEVMVVTVTRVTRVPTGPITLLARSIRRRAKAHITPGIRYQIGEEPSSGSIQVMGIGTKDQQRARLAVTSAQRPQIEETKAKAPVEVASRGA